MLLSDFLKAVESWALEREDIDAVALIGSQARGTARPESDVDLVVLTKDPDVYLRDTAWIARFGRVERFQIEPYGDLTSVRVWYANAHEVEYGLAMTEWTQSDGRRALMAMGFQIILDRRGVLPRC